MAVPGRPPIAPAPRRGDPRRRASRTHPRREDGVHRPWLAAVIQSLWPHAWMRPPSSSRRERSTEMIVLPCWDCYDVVTESPHARWALVASARTARPRDCSWLVRCSDELATAVPMPPHAGCVCLVRRACRHASACASGTATRAVPGALRRAPARSGPTRGCATRSSRPFAQHRRRFGLPRRRRHDLEALNMRAPARVAGAIVASPVCINGLQHRGVRLMGGEPGGRDDGPRASCCRRACASARCRHVVCALGEQPAQAQPSNIAGAPSGEEAGLHLRAAEDAESDGSTSSSASSSMRRRGGAQAVDRARRERSLGTAPRRRPKRRARAPRSAPRRPTSVRGAVRCA